MGELRHTSASFKSLTVSGSFNVSDGIIVDLSNISVIGLFTGSFSGNIGTASYSNFSISSSYILANNVDGKVLESRQSDTASYYDGPVVSASFSLSSSYSPVPMNVGSSSYSEFADESISSSYAFSASYAPFIDTNTWLETGSLYPITSSWSTNAVNWNSSSVVSLVNTKQNIIPTGSTTPFTSSWAEKSTSASYAPQNDYSLNTGSLYPITSSWTENWDSSSIVTLIETKQNALGTGSLYHITSSWSEQSISSSYSPQIDYSLNTGSNYPITSSWALNTISSSYAPYIGGTSLETGSFYPITSSWAENIISSSKTFNNVFSLRSNSDIELGYSVAYLSGYYSVGDGGESPIYYDSSDSSSVDDSGSIFVDSVNQRWKRFSNPIVPCKWFGAVGNNISDDTLPLQSWLNSLPTLGGTYKLNAGRYKTTSELLVNLGPGRGGIHIIGDGQQSSQIYASSSAQNVFHIKSIEPVLMRDFGIRSSVTKTDGAGIYVDTATGYESIISNQRSFFSNLFIANQWKGIHFVRAGYWSVTNCSITNVLSDGIDIQNLTNDDEGDQNIDGCVIMALNTSASNGIYLRGSSGLRIQNTKVNGGFTAGIRASAQSVQANILLVNGCSIENPSHSSISIDGTTYGWDQIVIVGNQFFNPTTPYNPCVNISSTNTDGVVLVGNQFTLYGDHQLAAQINNAKGVNVSSNVVFGLNSDQSTFSFLGTCSGFARNNIFIDCPYHYNNSSTNGFIVEDDAPSYPLLANHAKGDKVFNTSPAISGSIGSQYTVYGWVCTTAGSPGTWKEMKTPIDISSGGTSLGTGSTYPITSSWALNSTSASWSPTSGTSQWITSGSNIYYNDGKVGIGTSNPALKLTIHDPNQYGGLLITGSSPHVKIQTSGSSPLYTTTIAISLVNDAYANGGRPGDSIIRNDGSGKIIFNWKGTNNLLILTGSTSTLSSSLDVLGKVTATSYTGSLFGTSSWATNTVNWNSSSVITLIDTKQNQLGTGSLYPITSSWAENTISASYAPQIIQTTVNTASYVAGANVDGQVVSALNANSSVSSSYALTASYVENGGSGTSLITGSIYPITSSWSEISISASYAPSSPSLSSSYSETSSYAESTRGVSVFVSNTEPLNPQINDVWIKI